MSNHALGMSYIYAPCISSPHTSGGLQIFRWQYAACSKDVVFAKWNLTARVRYSQAWEGQISADLRTLIWGINETNAFTGETRKLIAALVRAAIASPHGSCVAHLKAYIRHALIFLYNLCRLNDTRDFTQSLVDKKRRDRR